MRILFLLLLFGSSCAFTHNSILPPKIISKNRVIPKMSLQPNDIISSITVNTAMTQVPIVNKSLTKEGIISSWLLGNTLWLGMSFEAWLISLVYFISGSLVTKIKFDEKEELGIAEKRGGKRGPENVLGSGTVPLLSSVLINLQPQYSEFFQLALVAAFATKLSDTFASEIGKAYGNNCYLITNFTKVPKGTEGAVSLEGTLAGIGGGFLISLVALNLNLIDSYQELFIINIAAFVATTIESYLGATLQDKQPWITNEFINLINTIIGAMTAITLEKLI